MLENIYKDNDLPYWIKRKGDSIKDDTKIESNIENTKLKEFREFELEFPKDSLVSKIREQINLSCVGLADRTLNLQYRRFKTFREDRNELILEEKKLYNLSSAEIEKYLDAIKVIYGNIDKDIKNISVDLEGFSKEVAQLLGSDYLNGNYILVSTNQKECDTARKYTSFSRSLLIHILEKKNIENILIGEAIIGKNNINFETIAKNPENIFNIEMTFDTTSKALSRLKIIKGKEKILIGHPQKLKDITFLKDLYEDIENIKGKYGSLDKIPEMDLTLRYNINYYKLNFDSIDIYCLKSDIPIFIYFDSDHKLEENCIKENLIILNGENFQSINTLVERGIIGYNPYLALQRAIEKILVYRNKKLNKFLKKNQESSEEIKKLFLEELMTKEDIPENVQELLLSIQKFIEKKNFDEIKTENKIYMLFPLIQDPILYEILTRMENNSFKSIYMNTDRFIQIASEKNDQDLEIFLDNVLDNLEFKEENNPRVNEWLKDNRYDLCQKLGIKFVKEAN